MWYLIPYIVLLILALWVFPWILAVILAIVWYIWEFIFLPINLINNYLYPVSSIVYVSVIAFLCYLFYEFVLHHITPFWSNK